MLPDQLEVVDQADLGLLDIGGSLLEGERQIAEELGERRIPHPGRQGRRRRNATDSCRRSSVEAERVGHPPPGRIAGGDEHVPMATQRQQRLELLGSLGTVIDQQPTLAAAQHLQQVRHLLPLVGLVREAQLPGEAPPGRRPPCSSAARGPTR